MIKTILVALDGSEHARKALRLAADLSKLYGAQLIASHVISDKPIAPQERHMMEVEYTGETLTDLDVEALMEVRGDGRIWAPRLVNQYVNVIHRLRSAIAEHILQHAKEVAHEAGLGDVKTLIEEGDPATAILDMAESHAADLIVLGSRGFGDIGGLLHGSVSHRVMHASKCSCLTVK